MRRQKKPATETERSPTDAAKKLAEWYTQFVNEHGYAAWERLLNELHEGQGRHKCG